MLLREISKNVQNQNWFAVGVELVIVVLGILLALGVDQWRADNNERKEEREILVALNQDITASIDSVEIALGEIGLITSGLQFLAEGPDGAAAKASPDDLDFHIANGLWETGVYTTEMNTYSDIISSGKLSVIDDFEIRRALAKYFQSFQLSLAMYNDVFEHQQNKLDAYLLDNIRLAQIFTVQAKRRIDRNDAVAAIGPTLNHSKLLGDDLFQNHVAAKYFLIKEYERYTRDMLEVLGQLQILVDSRIEVLGN